MNTGKKRISRLKTCFRKTDRRQPAITAGLDPRHAGLDPVHAGLDPVHAGLDPVHAGLDPAPTRYIAMKKLLFLLPILLIVSCQRTSPEGTAAVPGSEPPVPEAAPAASYLLPESALPAYEQRLDHAGLMADWTDEFYHKGRIVYRTACYNCHGDIEQPGSIPNSRQFWKEPFKNGSDPHAMYQTLTRGYGLMPPQVNLTPQEKYEVIHFIREEFLEEHNPDQYFEITDAYLDALPKGDTLGPDPQPYTPWAEMDYGRFLMRTYDLASTDDPPKGISRDCCPIPDEDFRHLNFAYKGIAIRLDKGAGGVAAGNAFVLFDHDLLRFTGFWTGEGFIDFEDILLDDQHNVFPRTVGKVQFENPIMPGWANPATGGFEDPRFVAVDGRPFGPCRVPGRITKASITTETAWSSNTPLVTQRCLRRMTLSEAAINRSSAER